MRRSQMSTRKRQNANDHSADWPAEVGLQLDTAVRWSSTPFPPFSPSLISLMVSVDVKHHVYGGQEQSVYTAVDERFSHHSFDWLILQSWRLMQSQQRSVMSGQKTQVTGSRVRTRLQFKTQDSQHTYLCAIRYVKLFRLHSTRITCGRCAVSLLESRESSSIKAVN